MRSNLSALEDSVLIFIPFDLKLFQNFLHINIYYFLYQKSEFHIIEFSKFLFDTN